ncbi:hypothetical protein [Halococcus sp. PRR34]|uniref:hypothetical protein n=1 Tax=Halococcus sp. PRR34 TaxID=3020830 RepID=UPI0023618893|nr:hypothetical protein [Halococcus sp. PRR34]
MINNSLTDTGGVILSKFHLIWLIIGQIEPTKSLADTTPQASTVITISPLQHTDESGIQLGFITSNMQSVSYAAAVMTWLERTAKVSFRFAVNGLVLFIPTFVLYVTGGFLGMVTGLLRLPYTFLSLQADPVFNLLVVSLGFLLCILNGALFFLTAFAGYDNDYREIVIYASCIGFGFGAGAFRVSFPKVVALV